MKNESKRKKMDKFSVLQVIFDDDPDGILSIKSKTIANTADDRLIASFQEINEFYEQHKREPQVTIEDVGEYKLYSRLKALREDGDKMMQLATYDRYDLLKPVQKEINSLEDILSDDSMDIFGDENHDLYNFKHIPIEKEMPYYIAKRKPCKDFEKFEQLFIQCQKDLRNRDREITAFKNEQQIDKGYFFVLKGVLLYVAKIGKRRLDKNKKMNARLRVIFENGTESDLLLRSLSAELYKDGRRVTEHVNNALDSLHELSDNDEAVGYIYVLASESKKDEIANIDNLYKIGYSSTSVENRIRNANQEATYLMDEVRYVAGWKCYNMNTQKFELLIHKFFGHVCLNIDIYNKKAKRLNPREWFVVPLRIIEQAMNLIISGEILHYRYDEIREKIIKK